MKITGYWRPLGTGYRRYRLAILDDTTAEGWVEDDFHHFGVRVQFAQSRITAIKMMAPRTPWTTCSGAEQPLQALVGNALITRASDIGRLIDMRLQCTHVYDLTGVLLAHIGNRHQRPARRDYLCAIEDRSAIVGADYELQHYGRGEARLDLDGQTVLRWTLDGSRIVAPESCQGIHLGDGFRAWTETLPEDDAEYATLLRRAITVAAARAINSDDYPTAADMSHKPLCYTFQPEHRHQAKRHVGNAKDYSRHPELLLRHLDADDDAKT